ncbi:MAG TPA: hypothetical protein PLJ62_06780 [Thermoflexales bacterium]|nr:hypothetical protein [Thermoflexales bacterium]HQW35072.1 hypothetical protein [Thermoflexales bacterium]HQX74761.1 hypothetical protein [Thermoflexales bacterium]HQZ21626.1 hypothetical protein [Thermoflexales bacterium]HQZ99881.1 hypothetical protein [Thermoflexales bacterium]
MSKRSRRDRRYNIPAEAFDAPTAKAAASPAKADGKPAVRQNMTARVLDWQAEYGDVIGDLKRTFIIAVALALIMVALSFVIR